MAESKIDFSYDNLHFSCEGDKNWVEAQLNQILNRIPGLSKAGASAKPVRAKTSSETIASDDILLQDIPELGESEKGKRGRKAKAALEAIDDEPSGDPLFEFLKEKNADKNQVKKFLAIAVYLHSQGIEKFSTPMVSKLLKSSHIEKLLNASDCLNKNEKKGFCIKNDKEFILTEAGIRSIIGGAEE